MPGGGRQPRGATQAHLPGDTPGETRSQGDRAGGETPAGRPQRARSGRPPRRPPEQQALTAANSRGGDRPTPATCAPARPGSTLRGDREATSTAEPSGPTSLPRIELPSADAWPDLRAQGGPGRAGQAPAGRRASWGRGRRRAGQAWHQACARPSTGRPVGRGQPPPLGKWQLRRNYRVMWWGAGGGTETGRCQEQARGRAPGESLRAGCRWRLR